MQPACKENLSFFLVCKFGCGCLSGEEEAADLSDSEPIRTKLPHARHNLKQRFVSLLRRFRVPDSEGKGCKWLCDGMPKKYRDIWQNSGYFGDFSKLKIYGATMFFLCGWLAYVETEFSGIWFWEISTFVFKCLTIDVEWNFRLLAIFFITFCICSRIVFLYVY